MKNKGVVNLDGAALEKLSKAKLIQLILEQQETFVCQSGALDEKEKKIAKLTEQLGRLQQEQDAQKTQAINKTVNEPSSKKPEWGYNSDMKYQLQCCNGHRFVFVCRTENVLIERLKGRQINCPDCFDADIKRVMLARFILIKDDQISFQGFAAPNTPGKLPVQCALPGCCGGRCKLMRS